MYENMVMGEIVWAGGDSAKLPGGIWVYRKGRVI
jgi:hypothetical protein